MTRRTEQGFARIWLAVIIVVVVLGLALAKLVTTKGSDLESSWKAGCKHDNRVTMTHSPMDLPDVATVTPIGLTAGAHVTPIDHLYFYPKAQERDAAPVYVRHRVALTTAERDAGIRL